jgi:hypothetical protein
MLMVTYYFSALRSVLHPANAILGMSMPKI